MATVKGVNRTLADDPVESNILPPGTGKGNVKNIQDTFEASAQPADDVIEMGIKLPKGARVLAVTLAFDALGGSTTLQVGDALDPDRYISDQATTAAGFLRNDGVDGFLYEVLEADPDNLDSQVLVTIGSGGAITGTVKLLVEFTHE